MPEQKFKLEAGGEERVRLSWRGMWKDIVVTFDGEPLGEPIPNMKALKNGRDYALPDGSALHVRFNASLGANRLEVSRDGHPLPGSDADPRVLIKLAAGVIWFVGTLSALFGALGMGGVELFEQLGFGWPSVAIGALFGGLGWLVRFKRSRLALALAVGLFALDGVLTLVASMDAGGSVPTTSVVVRIFLLIPMIQGFKAIGQAEAYDVRDEAVEAF